MKKYNFDNADYYRDENGEHVFDINAIQDKTGYKAVHSRLLVTDRNGVYIPQVFCNNYDLSKWKNIDEKDVQCCLFGPDENEWYWEAWDNILSSAKHIDDDGFEWRLNQDGDLFAEYEIEYSGY